MAIRSRTISFLAEWALELTVLTGCITAAVNWLKAPPQKSEAYVSTPAEAKDQRLPRLTEPYAGNTTAHPTNDSSFRDRLTAERNIAARQR